MYVVVEPREGTELDRLITALLNATGVVHQVIERTPRLPGRDGLEVIDAAAEQLRDGLACLPEHYSDEELAQVTGILAQSSLLVAADLGLSHHFHPGGPGIR